MFGRDFWLGRYGRLCFAEGDPAGGGGNPPDSKPDPDPLDGLSDAQKVALQKRIDTATAAARREAEKTAKTRFETEVEAKRKADDEERERQRQIAAGEFDKVKADYESKLAGLTGERDGVAGKLAAYERAVSPLIAALEAELPAEALAGYDREQDAATRLAWLQARKALVAVLRPVDPSTPRPPVTPKPAGNGKPEVRSLVSSF